MQDGKGAEWTRLLEDLMAETDVEKMHSKANELETAIFHRCQTLACGDPEDAERAAIRAATAKLLRVRVEKLGYPLDQKVLEDIERDSLREITRSQS